MKYMKKGDKIICITTSEYWETKEGRKAEVVKLVFYNEEHLVKGKYLDGYKEAFELPTAFFRLQGEVPPVRKTTVSAESEARFFGVPVENIRAQYKENAKTLQAMYQKALETGKTVRGFTAEQLKNRVAEFTRLANS